MGQLFNIVAVTLLASLVHSQARSHTPKQRESRP
jgi:hypothetical protein